MSKRNPQGFTLVELLVVIAVFMLLGLMAWSGLRTVIDYRTQTRIFLDRFNDIQFAVRRLENDLAQVQPRPLREEYGEELHPPLRANIQNPFLLEVTRGGWNNPIGLQRSELQRVAYLLEDGNLTRVHWNVLDRTPANLPVETELLDEVTDFRVRFLDYQREWHEQWPPQDQGPGQQIETLPLAIEFTLEFEDWGEISRLIEVIGG